MTTIITKNSSTAGAAPLAADLVQGELAVNVTSKALYTKNASAAVVKLNTPSIVDNGDATAITIDSSENVGIGTSSPSNKLSVVSPDNNAYTNVVSAYSNNLAQSTSLTFGGLRTVTGAGLGFYVNGSTTTAASIDTSGNLLVGTTSNSGQVSKQYVVYDSASGKGGIQLQQSSSVSNGNYVYFNNESATVIGAIYRSGTTNAVVYATTSDYRLKENVQPMTGALDKLAALKPCTYTWKNDGQAGQGFIAHELQAVVPDAVIGEKDDVYEDGSPKYQSIDTSNIVATLTAAIQEQQALINAQQAALTTLTERITALEAK